MKYLLATILIIFTLSGCSTVSNDFVGSNDKQGIKKKVNKLKATKDKIKYAETIDWIKCNEEVGCENKGKIKKYRYVSDVKVTAKKIKKNGREYTEDISKRTKNRVHFKIDETELLGASGDELEEVWIGKFYSGDPFYHEDGEWYQIETATSTVEDYNDYVSPTSTDVLIGATDSYFSAAGDGSVDYRADVTPDQTAWDTARDATTGSNAYPTSDNNAVVFTFLDNKPGKRMIMYRGFFPFTSIPSEVYENATAASLFVYPTSVTSALGGLDYVVVCEGTQASVSTLTTADYDQAGDVAWSDTLDLSSGITIDEYNEWTLNATGIAALAATVKLGMREGNDMEDNYPGLPAEGQFPSNNMFVDFSEQTGTDKDPYLEITYVIGGDTQFIPMLMFN